MCRRRYQSHPHPHPIQHLISEFTSPSTSTSPHTTVARYHSNPNPNSARQPQPQPRRRRGCCSHNSISNSHSTEQGSPIGNSGHSYQPRTAMAGLLLAGLSIGATKIQEKREKKKAKKAEELTSAFASGSSSTGVTREEQSSRSMRKSEEARREGDGRRSRDEGERNEVPPPSYDEVLQGDGMRYGNGGGVGSEGGRARRN
ncbi:hypothetical protein BCR34DRAFT_655761 [Clohesyomyces aquaticus]|uniref:Uncharacterized protein n=1 Tax=Clohesyomyces aquaticus TaxID=1231657 RepID=A0A1Y2A6L8_9PLEO|nr:hypothetical protein BCR34DRAFT_655761 [Clohesyomyces aquaticus]